MRKIGFGWDFETGTRLVRNFKTGTGLGQDFETGTGLEWDFKTKLEICIAEPKLFCESMKFGQYQQLIIQSKLVLCQSNFKPLPPK